MQLFGVITLILLGTIISGESLAFEFSNKECEFKVDFPFRPSVKKVVQALGNDLYSNTYMVQAGDNRSGRLFVAQCDTSFRLTPDATTSQKQKMAEWAMAEWLKMTNLKNSQMYWEEQGNHVTLRMIGRRVLVEAGEQINAAFQARMYLGQRSTMMVAVGEPASLSPSATMENFLDNSVKPTR
ncbi:MAG: hypothetical protein ISR48_02605 [Alphaproteobacteria bacterium]|nr:hypothetical protein [Alphaproteobacteria bacterium]